MAHLQWDFYNYVAALWLTGITTLSLGVFVYFKNRHAKLNKIFLAVSISMAIWGFGQGCIHSNYALSFTAARVIHFFVPFIAAFFFHLMTVLTEKPHKKFLLFSYITAALFSILGGFTKTIVASNPIMKISSTFTMQYSVGPGKLYIPYLLFFMLVVGYGNLMLYCAYRESSGTKRNQLKYMLIGSVIGFIGGISNFLYVFGINLYPLIPYATYMVTFYVVIATYAMIKHRLLDVKIALSRTGLLLLIYGLVIYISFQSMVFLQPYLQKNLGDKWLLVPIVTYMFLATAAPFIYLYAQRKMEEKLFKTQRKYQKTLKQLSGRMTRIRNLTKLLDLTAIQIVRNVGLTHVDIFLYNKDKDRYILKTSRGRFKKQAYSELKADNILIKSLYSIKGPLVFDEISNYGNKATKAFKETTPSFDTDSLKQAMRNIEAAVCMPGFIENHLIGFLVLGEKLSAEVFTQEDLDIFSTLANQATLAIDNAQSYEELISTKDQLLKGERLATIGEFASEVAHEIKNPLQAIKAFTELAYEKREDRSFIKKFSNLAKQEIERIDNFVRQLVKVSHPLPPKFGPVDVNEILDSILELMENDFNANNITIKKEYAMQSLRIEADKNQLKQVFLNLITNAVDAVEKTAKKVITVNTDRSGTGIIISISDTGRGIPADSMPHLFNPLFTTKETGSGLGLSIVDTMVRNHKGSIEVKNSAGEGSDGGGDRAEMEEDAKEGASFVIRIPVGQFKK